MKEEGFFFAKLILPLKEYSLPNSAPSTFCTGRTFLIFLSVPGEEEWEGQELGVEH
jgi:hypothetical protein